MGRSYVDLGRFMPIMKIVSKEYFMRFATYIKTAAVGFLQVANYRTEVWFQVFSKILVFAGIILLWSVIGSGNSGQTHAQLISYFLVANGVRELIDALYGKFGSYMIDDIKRGKLSAYLLQPTHTVQFMYFRHMGNRGVTMAFSIIYIIVGIILAPPTSLVAGILFVAVVVSASMISMAQGVMVGSGAFWMTEAKGVKNVVNHISKVFSGALIPLTFFPVAYQMPVMLSPFASYAYLPATVLQTKTLDSSLFLQIGASFFWAVSLLSLSRFVWRRGVKHYEAIGL